MFILQNYIMENFILMGNENSAIQCTRRQIRELSDGTLEVKIHIQPTDKANFLLLFPDIDLPAVIARLTQEAAKQSAQDEIIEADKPKGGQLARLAGMWCNEPEFWEWLETSDDNACHSERGAALCIYGICGIESRAELDNNPEAAEKFHRLIREPYSKWLKSHE